MNNFLSNYDTKNNKDTEAIYFSRYLLVGRIFLFIIVCILSNECIKRFYIFQDLISTCLPTTGYNFVLCSFEMILFYFIMRVSIARRYNENGRLRYLLCYHVKRYYRVAV